MALLVGLAACGRLGFDARDDDDAGTRHDAAVSDAAPTVDAAVCQPGPLGPPVRLAAVSVSGENDWGPWISDDGRTLLFGSTRPGAGSTDIWVSTRASDGDDFGPATSVGAINTAAQEDNPFLSADGLTLWFDRDNIEYQAVRGDVADPFDEATLLDLGIDEGYAAALSPDGLRYASTRDVAGNREVFLAVRATTADGFPEPTPLVEVNQGSFNCCPAFGPDDTLAFTGTPVAGVGLVVASWNGTTYADLQPFLPVEPADGAHDVDAYWSTDGRFFVFASDRVDDPTYDLYLLTAACE